MLTTHPDQNYVITQQRVVGSRLNWCQKTPHKNLHAYYIKKYTYYQFWKKITCPNPDKKIKSLLSSWWSDSD